MNGRKAKARRRSLNFQPSTPPTAHLDVRAYLVSRGYVRSRREASEALEGGKVSINGKTYAYPHFPKDQLDHDDCGRPRIMVEGTRDPRPCS